MPRYVWRDGDFVEITDAPPRPRLHIISDSHTPFKSMADGRTYDSKSAYRASLKAHGMVELGNEMPKHREFQPTDAGKDIKKSLEQVRAGKAATSVSESKLQQSVAKGKTTV